MALTSGFLYKSRRVWDESRFPGRDGVVLSYLIDSANFADVQIDGLTIRTGQILTSVPALSKRLGYTEKQIRTTLDHLQKGGELGIKTSNNGALKGRKNGTLITLINYRFYTDSRNADGQTKGEKDGRQTADKEATNKQVQPIETTINNSITPFYHPSLEEVRDFDRTNELHRDPEAFFNFHTPNWTDGNGKPIFNWQKYYQNWTNPGKRSTDLTSQIARVFGEN